MKPSLITYLESMILRFLKIKMMKIKIAEFMFGFLGRINIYLIILDLSFIIEIRMSIYKIKILQDQSVKVIRYITIRSLKPN